MTKAIRQAPRERGMEFVQRNGLKLEDAVTALAEAIHLLNDQWWRNPKTGRRITRNKGEMIALMHSELSEALEAVRKDAMDDKLPQWRGETMEMADCVIRILDYCAGHGLDIGPAIIAKLHFNYRRADHKPENRIKRGGKKL